MIIIIITHCTSITSSSTTIGQGWSQVLWYLYLSTLSTGCNVLDLVFKSNIRQTLMYLYLYLTHKKVLRSTFKYK